MSFDGTKWSEDRTEVARKLWRAGLSATQIASRLGGITRNAVIGRMHRIGESGRITPHRSSVAAKRPRTRTAKPVGHEIRPMPLPETPEPVIPLHERKGVLDLKANDCRWPIGDPKNADFHFCAHAKLPGHSYCEFHARKAYQAPQPMKERAHVPTGLMHRKLKAA